MLLTCVLAAQQPGTKQPSTQAAAPSTLAGASTDQTAPEPLIRTTVQEVVAPVTVYDSAGQYINNLQPFQFHLYDNKKEQNIHVDVTYQPISMVIAIQSNAHVESLLPQVKTIGTLIKPLVIGDAGEAAVVAYDSRIRTLQDFTSDPDKIETAVKKIYPGSISSRMVDAVDEGVRMLRTRPANRRRILLLIGETRDMGSEGRAREALIDMQLANVEFYSVDMSRFVSTLTAKPQDPRPNTNPPALQPVPYNRAATPTVVQQTWGTNGGTAEFIPLMVELFKDAKAVFKDNPVELFTKGTGGSEYSFYRQRGLESAIQKIGEELHSQYMITYTPNDQLEGGFHEITVSVTGAPEVSRVQTRPGYWLAGKPQ